MALDKRTIIEEPASGWKNAENPDVYVDIYGTTHAVWAADLSGIKRIFYNFDNGDLEFDPLNVVVVGSVNRNSDNPRIAANRSGRVTIVYEVENSTADGTDVYCSTNDGSLLLTAADDISNNSGAGKFNTLPRVVIHDETKDPHFTWLGTHPISGKTVVYYTRKTGTILLGTTYEVSPDNSQDCANVDVALMGDQNKLFVTFEQKDSVTTKQNIRLSFGNETGFSLLGQYVDSSSLTVLNRPGPSLNHTFPRIAVNRRIYDITEDPSVDDDPTIVVVWEDDDNPKKIRYIQRNATDFSDGTVAHNAVYRPSVCINPNGLIVATYFKTVGSNNIVNLSFKEIDQNIWTEVDDISNGHAFGDGIYNVEILCTGNNRIFISFKTGSTTGPQRIVHLNNLKTNTLYSFEIFAEELNSPSDTRSKVAMHIDDKIGNRFLLSDADSRAAVIFSDFNREFPVPDGIGDVHIFGGIVASKPTLITVADEDGDNKPEFTWFMPGDNAEGFFDLYYRICGASGQVPYQENIMLSGTYVSGISGIDGPGYIFSHEGQMPIDFSELYGFGVRTSNGPWSDEFCIRIGDISISHPTIIPPNSQLDIEKCDIVTLGGSAEPGSVIESQTLIEYSDVDGTIEINRTIITGYSINPQGIYSGSLNLSLLPNTASIRTEVIARDSDGNLSDPDDSLSNLVVVENIPPVLVSFEIQSQATCSTQATNSTTVLAVSVATGDVFEIKLWESIVDGGTGEAGASWVPYEPTIPFTFANGTNGVKTVFCKLRDNCGNESFALNAQIILDTVPPQLLRATYDPATRRINLQFNKPVTAIDLSKIRIVKP